MHGLIILKAKKKKEKKENLSNTTDVNTNLPLFLLGLRSLHIPPTTFIVSTYREPNNQQKWYM
jgi:hypothetical protein